MLLHKNQSFLEKKVSLEGFFQGSKNPVIK